MHVKRRERSDWVAGVSLRAVGLSLAAVAVASAGTVGRIREKVRCLGVPPPTCTSVNACRLGSAERDWTGLWSPSLIPHASTPSLVGIRGSDSINLPRCPWLGAGRGGAVRLPSALAPPCVQVSKAYSSADGRTHQTTSDELFPSSLVSTCFVVVLI